MMSEHPGDRRWEFHATAGPFYEIEGFGPGWVRRLVEEFGLTEAVEKLADRLSPHCDERESLRLKQLCYLAIQYQGLSSSRIRDFVRMVREKRVDRPQAAPIRVMTVHQSKGLEFDAVFVWGLRWRSEGSDDASQWHDTLCKSENLAFFESGLAKGIR
jgi:ATP-dependent exoDNAse (exonuclease V) beta subunit